MPSEARQKKIVEKLNRAPKCSILGPQNLGSGGGPPPWIRTWKWVFAKIEVENSNSICVKELEATKKTVIKAVTDRFDAIIKEAKTPTASLAEKVNKLNEHLDVVNRMKGDLNKFKKINDINSSLSKIAQIEGQLRDSSDIGNSYVFVEYTGTNTEALEKVFGRLSVKQKEVICPFLEGQ